MFDLNLDESINLKFINDLIHIIRLFIYQNTKYTSC